MKKKYIVTLTQEERQMLQQMLSRGKAAARKLMHARILLKADTSDDGPKRSATRLSSVCGSSLWKKDSKRRWMRPANS